MTNTTPHRGKAALNLALYREIIENCADAVVVLDNGQTITSVNNSAAAMFGHPKDFIVGKPLDFLIPERFRTGHQVLIYEFGRTNEASRYMQNRDVPIHGLRADGNEFPVNVSILKSGTGTDTAFVAIVRDVTVQKQTENELKRLASTDSLTGILNRRTFLFRAEQEYVRARRYSRPLTFAMIDIDNFKAVNDTYGHATGDHAITHVVKIVSAGLRRPDIFGRWGGEEFSLLLPETDEKSAMVTVQRLRKKVAATAFEVSTPAEASLNLTVSIGVSGIKPDSDGGDDALDDIINRADQALYLAKRSGRNRACAIESSIDPAAGHSAA